MNNFREIIYFLKHRYGTPIDIYTESVPILNPETGKNNIVRTKQHIRKAIVLTSNLAQLSPFIQQTNRLSGHSGEVNIDTRDILIDPRDVTVSPKLTDYIDYNKKRYDIASIFVIERFNRIYGWHIVAKEVKTSLRYAQTDIILSDTLNLAQTFDLSFG